MLTFHRFVDHVRTARTIGVFSGGRNWTLVQFTMKQPLKALRLREQELHLEKRAFLRSVREIDATAERLDDRLTDRQAHAETIALGREKWSEQLLAILLGDSGSIVLDRDRSAVFAFVYDRGDGYDPVTDRHFFHRVHAIRDEVEDDLLERDFISHHA